VTRSRFFGHQQTGIAILTLMVLVASAQATDAHSATYAFAIGSASLDSGRDVAVDDQGNAYVVGSYGGLTDFDPGPGSTTLDSKFFDNAYVAKYTPTGEFEWVSGVPKNGYATAVAVQHDFVFVAGWFRGRPDFDPGHGIVRLTSAGQNDGYLLKLRAEDGSFVWAKRFGGRSYDFVWTMAASADGLFIGGTFEGSADFDPGPGEVVRHPSDGRNGYILRLSERLGQFEFVWQTNGDGAAHPVDVAIDGDGNVLAVGQFYGQDVVFGPGAEPVSSVDGDGFLVSLSPGGDFQWMRRIGGYPETVTAAPNGEIFVAGSFQGSVDFDPGPGEIQRTDRGDGDIFVTAYTESGALKFVRTVGSVERDGALAIALDAASRLVVTGAFSRRVDFQPGPNEVVLTSAGGRDAFVWVLTPLGKFVAAHRLGGSGWQEGYAVATAGEDIIVTGTLHGRADFDPGRGRLFVESAGYSDAFLVRLTEH
jgi:hypothetical protein